MDCQFAKGGRALGVSDVECTHECKEHVSIPMACCGYWGLCMGIFQVESVVCFRSYQPCAPLRSQSPENSSHECPCLGGKLSLLSVDLFLKGSQPQREFISSVFHMPFANGEPADCRNNSGGSLLSSDLS